MTVTNGVEPDDLEEGDDEHKPPTIFTNQQLDDVIEQGRSAIVAVNDPPRIFRHGKLLVRVWRVKDEVKGGDYPALVPYDVHSLRELLAKVAYWKRRNKDGNHSHQEPPPSVVGAILNATDELDVPEIDQVVSAPIFGVDGKLVTRPGYHPSSRCWYEPDPDMIVPDVPMDPGPKAVLRAKQLIFNELLADFPFETTADRAHALGLFILPFVRPMIAGPTPLHPVDAPTVGTGKGLCAQALTYPALGRDIPATPEIVDNNEMRKQITSLLLAGRNIVRFDNVQERVDSAALAAALTERVWDDRVLGVSRNASLRLRCIWVMTGNNLDFSQEMGRRLVRIRLNSNVEKPWKRSGFRHPELMKWAEANRGDLVWAALVLVRAWLAAGQPTPPCKPLGSFEDWTRVVGGIVANAGPGGAHFLSNVDEVYDQTVSDSAEKEEFIRRWWTRFGEDICTVKDLQGILETCPGDPFSLGGRSERGQATAFGSALRGLHGQVLCGDLQVFRAGVRSSYRLRRLGPADD